MGMSLAIWGRQQLDGSQALSSLLAWGSVQKRWHHVTRGGGGGGEWERRSQGTPENKRTVYWWEMLQVSLWEFHRVCLLPVLHLLLCALR